MNQIPVYEIKTPDYKIPNPEHFSGAFHYTEFGTPVRIEYWQGKPNFKLISEQVLDFLRGLYLGRRLGIRMVSSMKHPRKTRDELVEVIQELGHDLHDNEREDSQYENFDLQAPALFMLETDIGKYDGLNGEEQIKHALNSFYLYPDTPTRVDLIILYDPSKFQRKEIVYAGKREMAHVFANPTQKPEAILAILKLI